MKYMKIRRGDIFYIERYGSQCGSEQRSGRPAVIVSNNANNEFCDTVEVVYLTTSPKKDLPTHVEIESSYHKSIVLCEQVTTVSTDRLGNYIGHCTEEELCSISDAIIISLALKDRYTEKNDEATPAASGRKPTAEPDYRKAEIERLRAERNTYKELVDRLLDRLVERSAESGVA